MTTPYIPPPVPSAAVELTPAVGPRPTPILNVQILTFLCSIGTGLVTNGIFYLTVQSYGFSRLDNLVLMFIMGLTYIIGAKGAGTLVRTVRRALPWVSSRGVLALLMLAMASLLMLPTLVSMGRDENGAARGVWAVWVVVLVYSPMTGVLWPMVESFLSGGRSGERLRSATGVWNVVWSGAIMVPYVGLSALVEKSPVVAFEALAGVHVLCAVLLGLFEAEPAPHIAEEHEPHPPVYTELLQVFRVLLPLSYFVFSALNPILPSLMESIGVGARWRPIVGLSWLFPRVVMFGVLGRWQGWHGKWGTAIAGAVLILGGFAMAVLSPLLGTGEAPIVAMVAGLAVFGVGLAVVYSAAIYYAMEVGKAEVDAGGTHEALIGLGYTLGPGCGLAASGMVAGGVLTDRWFEVAVVVIVGVIGGAAGTYAVARARAKRAAH